MYHMLLQMSSSLLRKKKKEEQKARCTGLDLQDHAGLPFFLLGLASRSRRLASFYIPLVFFFLRFLLKCTINKIIKFLFLFIFSLFLNNIVGFYGNTSNCLIIIYLKSNKIQKFAY